MAVSNVAYSNIMLKIITIYIKKTLKTGTNP